VLVQTDVIAEQNSGSERKLVKSGNEFFATLYSWIIALLQLARTIHHLVYDVTQSRAQKKEAKYVD